MWPRRRRAVGRAPWRHTEEAPVLTVDLDRSSPTPLYFQLAQAIEGAIAGGDLPAGSRLENEILLAQRYGLSRPTVRRADRKSTRLNSSHANISYAVLFLEKNKDQRT